ncbi:MAG: EVE domain-containing protein [Methanotrichaceae archaeon]|nr:EVE domain-containing protein [Methanotrichaceae archaeon]
MLENEIFAGFKFFSDIITEFNFPFSKIGEGKQSFENYLQINRALHVFANIVWLDLNDLKSIQKRIHYFIYNGLGSLFLTRNDYNQYWIMSSGERDFEYLDTEPEIGWSGREEMQKGNLVFMYRQTPRKAITDIYQVDEDPYFDPFGGWKGFWVSLKKITPIKDITMVEMKHDESLKHLGFVKVSSQGVSTAPMPYFAYNRLLELIDKDIRDKHNLQPEITANFALPNEFATETEFEDSVIEPLLKHWGFKHQRQFSCEFIIGSQHHTCQVDFLLKDSNNEDITLFENKIRIANEKELTKAVAQAKSYALQLGMGGFVVASPEGFWVYKLDRNREIPIAQIAADKVKEIEELKSLILKFRAS